MLKERQGQEQEGKQGGQRHSYESRRILTSVMKAEEPLTSVMKAEEPLTSVMKAEDKSKNKRENKEDKDKETCFGWESIINRLIIDY